jgi:hypothetical protein
MSLKENAIILGIAVLFTTFAFVGIDTFYQRPDYGEFCKSTYYRPYPYPKEENCTHEFSIAEDDCYQKGGMPEYDYDEKGCQQFKECNFCSMQYEDAQSKYSNNVMIILAAVGAAAILFGVYFKVDFIGTGFMFSGILIMFISTIQNFNNLNKFSRMAVVFLELCLILFIAYKKVLPEKKKTKSN